MRLSYENDYSEGCLPEILDCLCKTNFEQTSGYGVDQYSESATQRIAMELGVERSSIDVFFTTGGTLANAAVITHLLRPHQGVLSATCGHINHHESGAIEAGGHKILEIHSDPHSGKIDTDYLENHLTEFWSDPVREHMVQPGMIYLSNLNEQGSFYDAVELERIRMIADRYDLPIYMDGARLGTALMAAGDGLRMEDLPRLVDVFTIGGTKMGALFGEAIVFTGRKPSANYVKDFYWILKQKGGRLAKGRLLGLQFDRLFTDGLYFTAAAHANEQAEKLREGFRLRNIPLWVDNAGNQVFVLLKPEQEEHMMRTFKFERWSEPSADELLGFGLNEPHRLVRLCTSFATASDQANRWFEVWDQMRV